MESDSQFGNGDELNAWSADGLLESHYVITTGRKPKGIRKCS